MDGGAKSLVTHAKNTEDSTCGMKVMAKLVQNWTLFHLGAAKLAPAKIRAVPLYTSARTCMKLW